MKGYELIKKIQNGEIDNCRVKCETYDILETISVEIVEIRNKKILWEPGKFDTNKLTDSNVNFEVINKQIDIHAIEPISFLDCNNNLILTDKVNELITAVKDLDSRLNIIK